MIKANYHTHTVFCDGKSTPEEIAQEAIKLGLEHLGFSGHIDISPVMDVSSYLNEVRRVQEKYKNQIDILCGGELDNMYEDREPKGLDYLIGSVHHMKVNGEIFAVDWKEDMILRLLDYFDDGYRLAKEYFRLIGETYGKGKCDIIGHYDLITRYNDKYHFIDEDDPRYLNPAYEVMEYLVNEGLPFEINTKLAGKGKIYPGRKLLMRLKELGGEIILSSDAHQASDLLHGFDEGTKLAKECGFDHANIMIIRNNHIEFDNVDLI